MVVCVCVRGCNTELSSLALEEERGELLQRTLW